MSTVRPLDAARDDRTVLPHRFAALPRAAAFPRLPAKPRLNALDPSLWWVQALRRTLWRWQRGRTPRALAALVWC